MKTIDRIKSVAPGSLLLPLLLLIAACSQDADSNLPPADEDIAVIFNIGTPESGEVEYTPATRAETESEKKIETLRVYDFLVTGSSGNKKALLSAVHYLKKVAGTPRPGEFKTEYVSATGALTATLALSLRVTGNTQIDPPHIFAFVANEGEIHFDSIQTSGGTPLDSLLYSFSTRRLKSGESCDKLAGSAGFVMTSLSGEIQITKGMGVITLPQLRRMVARIDVTHNAISSRNLKILSVGGENCTSRGYLFDTNYAGTATGEKYDYKAITSVAQNSAVQDVLPGLTTNTTCENVLFLYEHPATQGGKATPAPALLLRYSLNGAVNTMTVPLVVNGVRISLRRNYKYKLIVGTEGGASTRVVCALEAGE